MVWLRDRKTGNNLYFAHLQEFKVKRYDRVNAGDTIGTVGNTGNARFTPPHLHFGIYNHGPINPFSFIVKEYERPAEFKADTVLLGKEIKLREMVSLKGEMALKAPVSDTLLAGERLKITAVNHDYVRIIAESGKKGFLTKTEIREL